MKKALVIIDIQNDYFPGGTHTLFEVEQAGSNAHEVLVYARNKGFEIIHVQHIAVNEGADFFLAETEGAKINNCVQPNDGEKIIIKNYPNSFRDTDLLNHLRKNEINDLVVCGMMTDVCVAATVRAAMDFGFNTTIIGDACATEDRQLYGKTVEAKDIHTSFLAGLTALGNVYADVITTEQFLLS